MTTPDPARNDPVTTAQGLAKSLKGMTEELARLRRYGRHNRWFIAVDVVLTVLLAFTGSLAVHSAQVASQASTAQMALCRAGNVARAQQVGIWDFVLNLSGPPKTTRERQVRVLFERRLHRVFMPRDCVKLGQPGGPATSTPSALPGR